MLFSDGLLFNYCASVLALACIPGISSASLARNTLAHGESAGLNMALGILLARLSKGMLILFCLAQVSDFVQPAHDWLKILGAVYFAWVGLRVMTKNGTLAFAANSSACGVRQLTNGFLVSWSNPNALLFVAIVLPGFLEPGGHSWEQVLVLAVIWAFLNLTIELFLVLFAARWAIRSDAARFSNMAIGGVLLLSSTWILAGM